MLGGGRFVRRQVKLLVLGQTAGAESLVGLPVHDVGAVGCVAVGRVVFIPGWMAWRGTLKHESVTNPIPNSLAAGRTERMEQRK